MTERRTASSDAGTTMIALSCSSIKKLYGIDEVLSNITFSINSGDKVGLIGRNGAGKTTLFNIITKQLDYDEGDFFLSKDTTIGYLAQHLNTEEDLTIEAFVTKPFEHLVNLEKDLRRLEAAISEQSGESSELLQEYSEKIEAFEAQDGYRYHSEIRGVLHGMGFHQADFNRRVDSLSGGQRSRLALARLLLIKPDILMLDEPTNHLDITALTWLEDYIKSYKKTVILISHDRYFLDQTTTVTVEIENGQAQKYVGNYSVFVKKKKEQYSHLIKAFEKQQQDIKRQEELIRSFKQRGTEKLANRARSREKRLNNIELLERPEWSDITMNLTLEPKIESGRDVLRGENIQVGYGSPLFSPTDFAIYRGDRIGLIGDNGIGKTTLFKAILKQLPLIEGEFFHGHKVFTGYFDQEQKNFEGEGDLIGEVQATFPTLSETEIRTLLGAFMFKADEVFKSLTQLSGGEKSRLALLKLMLSESNFLLLDEPTNHLDLFAKEALEQALIQYTGTMLVISHDRYFLNNVCTKIFNMTSDGIEVFHGNYDYYLSKLDEDKILSEYIEADKKPSKTERKLQAKKEREERAKERAKVKTIQDTEDKIHAFELKLAEIEEALCDPDVYSDNEKAKEYSQQREDITRSINDLFDQLENLLH